MKKFLFPLLMLVVGTNFQAQSLSFTAKTGDAELDLSLNDINIQAKADLTLFKKDLSVEFNLSTSKVDLYLKTMEPADVYMAVLVSSITSKPVETVNTCYTKNKGKGWGVIAKEMGIKPGSAAFHELKNASKNKKGKMKGNKGKGSASKGKSKGNKK